MKKILFISFFCFLFEFACQGQNMYSLENLQQSSPEVLSTYLTFAKKQKKTGGFIMKTGLVTAVAGFLVTTITYDPNEWIGINTGTVIGAWMMLLGTGATIVGLPIHLTGSARVRKIISIMSQTSSSVTLEINPYSFQSNIVQKNLYGATIRIRF